MISRERILEAAARVYSKHGFRGATTRLIAAEAGVNEVTLFRTFGSKGALLEAVLEAERHGRRRRSAPRSYPSIRSASSPSGSTPTSSASERSDRMLIHAISEYEERPEVAGFACRGRVDVHQHISEYVARLHDARPRRPRRRRRGAAVTMLISSVMSDAMGRPMAPRHLSAGRPGGRPLRALLPAHARRAAPALAASPSDPPTDDRPFDPTCAGTSARACALGLLLAVSSPIARRRRSNRRPPPPTPLRSRSTTPSASRRARARRSRSRAPASRRASGQLRVRRAASICRSSTRSLAYARALRSQFQALASGGGADTSTAPEAAVALHAAAAGRIPRPQQRAAALAQATTCPAVQGIDFSRVGFGARNSWTLGLSVSQTSSPAAA